MRELDSRVAEIDRLVDRTRGPQPGRRLFHAANGLAIWGTLYFLRIDAIVALLALAGIAGVALAIDLARLANPSLNRLFFTLLPHFASPREASRIASSTWYLLGALGALLLFPRPYAEVGILVLALADPAASWFGRRYGVRRFGSGSRLGSSLFWCVTLAVLWPVAGVWAGICVATFVTLLEAAPWGIDDNLVVPIATAGGLWVVLGIGG